MDLALNNLQRLICHKTQLTNHQTVVKVLSSINDFHFERNVFDYLVISLYIGINRSYISSGHPEVDKMSPFHDEVRKWLRFLIRKDQVGFHTVLFVLGGICSANWNGELV